MWYTEEIIREEVKKIEEMDGWPYQNAKKIIRDYTNPYFTRVAAQTLIKDWDASDFECSGRTTQTSDVDNNLCFLFPQPESREFAVQEAKIYAWREEDISERQRYKLSEITGFEPSFFNGWTKGRASDKLDELLS